MTLAHSTVERLELLFVQLLPWIFSLRFVVLLLWQERASTRVRPLLMAMIAVGLFGTFVGPFVVVFTASWIFDVRPTAADSILFLGRLVALFPLYFYWHTVLTIAELRYGTPQAVEGAKQSLYRFGRVTVDCVLGIALLGAWVSLSTGDATRTLLAIPAVAVVTSGFAANCWLHRKISRRTGEPPAEEPRVAIQIIASVSTGLLLLELYKHTWL